MAGLPPSLRGLLQQFGGLVGPGNGADSQDLPDTSEQVYISSLALLKMLKHGRAGVPMEVMGLMLGEFIDDYTVRVVDVFSMPQSGNSVSIEAVDYVYQTEMLEQLKRTGRPEMVVGWYHSHPGFGCWFSGTDVSTQQSFEQLNQRAVGVVIDPIQSVKGKVVMDCFRLINPHLVMLGQEPRQTTSNIGHLQRPTITALVHGLNRNYYSIAINCRKGELEHQMLTNLHKNKWNDALKLQNFEDHHREREEAVASLKSLSAKYTTMIEEEIKKKPEQLLVDRAGQVDAKMRLQTTLDTLVTDTLLQSLGSMISTLVF
ncbi:26S proteasome non-ATPase regulatory subunit 14 homolog [Cyclospora cayetanensis]|uniref:26S proteasome non-ATPase regulatory subunit 14 homolog n=1 Tax=Cyclospora cayetanensis TaxID=88456 RepID=A0A6P6S2J7_9EIME|nr:26S proteasome non-ATPase regulatory subunit 14 homolog [Cyclospora cayetanensis]